MMTDDMDLVREYAARQSEPAFEALVTRYINLVYATALRQVRDAHLAEEITQAVFIILARKAGGLNARTILPSWLHRTAVYAAADVLKTQRRRAQREQEALMQSETETAVPEPAWELISPLLDEALVQLGEQDRQAVLLHFFQKKTFAEVGGFLGMSEETARKRTNRVLEKLRKIFSRRGVHSTTAILAGALSANSAAVAPAMLAKSVTALAVAKGATAGGSTLTLVKGALKIMAWTKAKTVIAVGVGFLLAAGTTAVIVKKTIPPSAASTYEAVFAHPSSQSLDLLETAPPTLIFRPTQSPKRGGSGFWTPTGKCVAVNFPLSTLFGIAYGFSPATPARVVLPDDFNLRNTNYDILITLPDHQKEALQEELKKQFGLAAHTEIRQTDVLLLKIADPATLQLHQTKGGGYANYLTGSGNTQKRSYRNVGLAVVAEYVEVKEPVFDRTESKEHYDFDFPWPEQTGSSMDAVKSALDVWNGQLSQAGLDLVPSREPIEMLIVEKAK